MTSQSVNAQQPSTLQRVAYTLLPLNARTVDFVLEIAKGNNIQGASKKVSETGEAVRQANKQTFKQNIHEMKEDLDNMGDWKYFVPGPVTIWAIDKLDEKFNQ